MQNLTRIDDSQNLPQIDEPAMPEGVSPLVQMLSTGMLKKDDVENAMALQKMHDEYEAKKAFSEALAKFRKMAPTLKKDKVVDFSSQKGRTHYKHTSLGYGMSMINPILGECDLNLSWKPRVEGGMVYVSTSLTHTLGHSESVELPAEFDQSGNKNKIQAMKSAISYLERIGAFSLLGLASSDDDDDGRSTTPSPALVAMCDESDIADIRAVCDESGKDFDKWVKWKADNKKLNLVDGSLQIPKSQKAVSIKELRSAAAKQEGAK